MYPRMWEEYGSLTNTLFLMLLCRVCTSRVRKRFFYIVDIGLAAQLDLSRWIMIREVARLIRSDTHPG